LVLLQFLRRTAVRRERKAGCSARHHTAVHEQRTKVGRLFTSQFDMPACRHIARPHSLSAWLDKLLVQAGFLHKQQQAHIVWVSQGEPLGHGAFSHAKCAAARCARQHEQMRSTN